VFCGEVTDFKYEEVVYEDRDSRGEPMDITVYSRNDLRHKRGCVAADGFKDGPKRVPLSKRVYGPGGVPIYTQD
jgi:hypothetical protein